MSRWWKRTFTMVATSSLLAACGGPATTAADDSGGVVQDDDGKQDAIGGYEAPETLVAGATRRLASNIVGADIGKTFGTDDAHVPYPDTYWPFTDEGVDASWNGGDSALAKYMQLTDATNLKAAKDWEHQNHGNGVPGVGGWWGHCPGWTGAAMANAPILHAVFAKSDGNGGVVACTAGTAGCTKFEIGDLNALMAEVYVDGDSSFIGARCDTAAASVKRDANGRITTPGCGGVNPGTLLIVASARMKKQHLPFAIDAQNDYNTDQIWNQPAYRYTVNRYQSLTAAQAANLVVHGTMSGDATAYPYNAAAKGFALVDLTLHWVSERGPNTTMVSGLESSRETRMVAVIELDKPASNRTAKILGGEFVDDASVGADRLTVPPFLWVIHDAGPEDEPSWSGGDGHNPYVKSSRVKQLIALGQQ